MISLGFRTDVMLRGMAGAIVEERQGHLVVRTPHNPGHWWGNFLLMDAPAGPGDAVRWAKLFAAEFPTATHLAFGVDGVSGEAGDPGELAALGVTSESSSVLTANGLRPPERPAAAECRALRTDDDWAQSAELRRATDDQPPSPANTDFLDRKLAEERRLCEAGHGAWFGAFVNGRMRAGLGLFGDGSGLARFQHVETHPEFRRLGLASSLLHHASQWGRAELDARTFVIVADPDYTAIRIYRALGFTEIERQAQAFRPAYGPFWGRSLGGWEAADPDEGSSGAE